MTNEELVVLDGFATELIEKREQAYRLRLRNDAMVAEHEKLVNEKKRLLDELNRLRESEANALNAAEESKRERDEARKKFGEWILFVESQVFVRLRAAMTKKNLRREVEETIDSMVKFQDKHPTSIIEGGMAK